MGETAPLGNRLPMSRRGFTILEITVILAVILILVSLTFYAYGGWNEWKLGSQAGTELRLVHSAQKTYLAEHPLESASDLTAEKVIPYLSSGASALPTVEDLDGNQLTINVSVMPPVIDDGSGSGGEAGSAYDPSGSSTDGLWDVGE